MVIKLAWKPEDDNVRYMLYEKGGKPKCGTVPMNDLFRQVYRLCAEMHDLEEKVQETVTAKSRMEASRKKLFGGSE